jgi:hypothetical protein
MKTLEKIPGTPGREGVVYDNFAKIYSLTAHLGGGGGTAREYRNDEDATRCGLRCPTVPSMSSAVSVCGYLSFKNALRP